MSLLKENIKMILFMKGFIFNRMQQDKDYYLNRNISATQNRYFFLVRLYTVLCRVLFEFTFSRIFPRFVLFNAFRRL